MTIDEAIAQERGKAEMHRNNIVPKERYHNMPWIDKNNEVSIKSAEENEQLAEWLEKLKTVENIMLIYNANWYADEDGGVPDCEVLESIWNVIQDNGLDIDIEQDYRKGKSDGYNKALDDIVTIIKERVGMDWEWDFCFIEQIAEQLKAGGMNEYNI